MRKILYLFLFICFDSLSVLKAQDFSIETSSIIKDDIGSPTLLMSDGTTVFFKYDLKKKKGFISVFDSKHSLVVSNVSFSTKLITDYNVSLYEGGAFWAEINSKILFYVKGKEGLAHFVINPKTGLVESEKLVDQDEYIDKEYYFKVINSSRVFMLKKSGKTNDLKVLEKNNAFMNNQFLSLCELDETGKRTELSYDYFNNEFNAIGWIYDISVFNSNSVGFITSVKKYENFSDFKGPTSKQMHSQYFVRVNFDTKKIDHLKLDELTFGESYSRCKISSAYDSENLYLLMYKIVKSSKNRASLITTEFYDIFGLRINPTSFKVEKRVDFATNKLIEHLKSEYDNAESYYNQLIYKSWVDKNENYHTITSQYFSVSKDAEMNFINPRIFSFNKYDKNGSEVFSNSYRFECNEGFFIHYFQKLITTSENSYFLINNIPVNVNENKYVKIFDKIEKTDTYFIKMGDEKFHLEKLFPNETNSYLFYDQSLYSVEKKVYVALKMRNEGKERSVVWIKFK